MTGKQQGGAGARQAACDAAKTFTDHAADGGKLTAAGVIAQ